MTKRHKGFTLAEMVVVMGIIILFITMAIPVVRSLTGTTSIGMTRNNIAALLARAREEAIGVQSVRGVMFFVDPTSNRIIGVIVQAADIQDSNISNCLLLDAVPNRDTMPLPAGVRLQTVFNGVGLYTSGGTPTITYPYSAVGTEDRYLGFNPLPVTVNGLNVNGTPQASTIPVKIGGTILFDGNGKLITKPYGFQMAIVSGNGVVASNLCILLNMSFSSVQTACTSSANGMAYNNSFPQSYEYIPGYLQTAIPPPATVTSQVGLILFNYDAFVSNGFTDQDADIMHPGPPPTSTYATPWPVAAGVDGDNIHSEQEEETWLDTNSTPLMVNRYDGTLIRGE